MLGWYAQTTLVAALLALVALGVGRAFRLGPAARHVLWLVALAKMITPPMLYWPWSFPVAQPAVKHPNDTREMPLAAIPIDDGSDIEAMPLMPDIELEDDGPAVVPPLQRDALEIAEVASASPQIVEPASMVRGAMVLCALGGCVLLAGQAMGALRFMRRLRRGESAPAWLDHDMANLAKRMGVRVPRVVIVPGSGTPLLWCLTRPVLVVPAALVVALDRLQWRGVLAHELAHIRRGDVWVSRMLLAAGWLWWWNPLYWCVKYMLERDAELACDAWAVELADENRRGYAESLIEVCSLMSVGGSAGLPVVPALGMSVQGDGRFFERRLTMILRGRALHRYPLAVKAGAALLALLAMPMWSAAQSAPVPPRDDDEDRPRAERPERPRSPVPPLPPELPANADDEDQQPEAPAPPREVRRQLERARAAEERARATAERVRARRVERAKETDDNDVDEANDKDAAPVRRAGEERVRDAERRVREMQERARDRMNEARETMRHRLVEAKARADEARAKGDGDEEPGEARKHQDDARMLAEKLRHELQDLNEKSRAELQEAHEQLRRAHAELAESVRRAGGRGDGPGADAPRAEAPEAPELPRVPGAPHASAARRAIRVEGAARAPMAARSMPPGVPGGDFERLERRLDQLEAKFDRILEELHSIRSARP